MTAMTAMLPTGTTSGRSMPPAAETVTYWHAVAPVYYPAPGGATYCNSATCTHRHRNYDDVEECAQRLARIIATGRLPKWATLSNPI